MVVDIGETVARAICQNCGLAIEETRFSLRSTTEWLHTMNGATYCPGSHRAWPKNGTVQLVEAAPS